MPLLRVPPFPGARSRPLATPAREPAQVDDRQLDAIGEAIRSLRVGGTFWGAQPTLPDGPYQLVRIKNRGERDSVLSRLSGPKPILCVLDGGSAPSSAAGPDVHHVVGDCDPWHLLGGASEVIVDSDDELAPIAAIHGVAVRTIGKGPFDTAIQARDQHALVRRMVRLTVGQFDHFDPFTGDAIGPLDAVSLCGFWRSLIDSNRDYSAAIGFAFWKRATLAPLLWAGPDSAPFQSNAGSLERGEVVAVWKSRTSPSLLADLDTRGIRLVEVEDGFIRSAGLGADCVPPLSIVVDRLGVHFDPERPSELERMLESGPFPDDVLDRARQLRERIVKSGLSKYEAGGPVGSGRTGGRRRILVPGQVEDDRAVVCGGQGLTSNVELLRRVRENAPEDYILYKPHPDVEAGHRKGAIPDETCRELADEIVRGQPISGLIDGVDEVHVNTSLAGFEALLRGKPVTTHGVPFYAGWGLTTDLGPVPDRRTAKRSLDELVAAVLLLYPRYLDPQTRLPCPPEILVRRLTEDSAPVSANWLVTLRRLQGRSRRLLGALRSAW